MLKKKTNVLFVSDENSCRSLLAEACLNHLGGGSILGHSCGIPGRISDRPEGWTRVALQTAGIPDQGLRCKAWTEYTKAGSTKMDFVIALDQPTMEMHPVWPGQPVTALWDYPYVDRSTKKRVDDGLSAVQVLVSLRRRIELLVSLHARVTTFSDLQHDIRDLSFV